LIKIALVILFSNSLNAIAAKDPDLLVGDVAQVLVPAASLAMTYYFDDSEGRKEWMKSTAATLIATEVLKYSFDSIYLGKRPNGGNRGFPSGHSSAACSGAFFMADRYGWRYGAPGLAIAAITGYSRVDEGFHHWRDVIAGCALSYGVSRYFVDSMSPKITITPEIGSHSFGATVGYHFQ
jgi:membrane-associated phospholipid phosphatase